MTPSPDPIAPRPAGDDLPPIDRATFERRRRQRSYLIAGLLLAMVVLFFFIALARFQQ